MGVSYVSLNELQSTGHVVNLMFLGSLNLAVSWRRFNPGGVVRVVPKGTMGTYSHGC